MSAVRRIQPVVAVVLKSVAHVLAVEQGGTTTCLTSSEGIFLGMSFVGVFMNSNSYKILRLITSHTVIYHYYPPIFHKNPDCYLTLPKGVRPKSWSLQALLSCLLTPRQIVTLTAPGEARR